MQQMTITLTTTLGKIVIAKEYIVAIEESNQYVCVYLTNGFKFQVIEKMSQIKKALGWDGQTS